MISIGFSDISPVLPGPKRLGLFRMAVIEKSVSGPMSKVSPRIRFTSAQRGEVDLRSKSGEGGRLHRETVTPHPALRADLSQWER